MSIGRVVLVLLLAASPAYADLRPFHISAPDGWQEITSLPPEALAKLPPAIVDQLRRTHYELMAADVEHATGGFTPSMNVIVNNAGLRVTASSLRKGVDELMSQMRRSGVTARLVSSRIVPIDGVDTARLELETAFGDIQVHQIIYMLPGGDRTAIVTFTASPAQFPGYEPLFDQTAAASRGLKEAPVFDWNQIILAGAVGGVAAGLVSMVRKRNKLRRTA